MRLFEDYFLTPIEILLSDAFFCIIDFLRLGDTEIDFDYLSRGFKFGYGLPANKCETLDLPTVGEISNESLSDCMSAQDSVNCCKSAAFLTGLKDSKNFTCSAAIFSFLSF